MRLYPALDLRFPQAPDEAWLERTLAELDQFSPVAVETVGHGVRVFFASAETRDAARRFAEAALQLTTEAIDVADDDWAERSQASLGPVVVGRLTVAPPWAVTDELCAAAPGPVVIIQPSMGFGTGHHASTRLCLRLLQQLSLQAKVLLDVGTGSGVLAIAASVLGAARVVGVDVDPDALTNARENLALNFPDAQYVEFQLRDLDAGAGPLAGQFDLVLANLTGGLLRRRAASLASFAGAGGRLIASGFTIDERSEVVEALTASGWRLRQEVSEQEWIGAVFVTSPTPSTAR